MSTPCDERETCPGCEKTVATVRYNQPGLPAISYRLGTHGEFFQRMLDQLHTDELLRRQLTTRSRDDFAIALLDAWAVVGDVLTFYQERIANEGFLRTAIERRSILEVARTIGYELNPGVAASTYLALTVDDTNPNYATATVPQGTQVQSIPAQGQLPQTFETSAEFEAHVEWNGLKPRSTRHQTLGIGSDDILYFLSLLDDTAMVSTRKVSDYYLVNPDSSLADDDIIIATEVNQIYFNGVATNLKAGDLLLLVGEKSDDTTRAIVRQIVSVEIDKELSRTVVQLTGETGTPCSVMKKTLNPVASVATGLTFNADSIAENVLYTDIREETLQALMTVNEWEQVELLKHVNAVQAAATPTTGKQGVFALREHVGFFGSNAPSYTTTLAKDYTPSWDTSGWEIWKPYPNDSGIKQYYSDADIYLERKVEGIGKSSWVVFECPSGSTRFRVYQVKDVVDQSITGFSLSGKASGLKLYDTNGNTILNSGKAAELKVRNTSAHVKSELLELSDLIIDDDLEEEGTDSAGESVMNGVSSMMLDTMVLGLQIGQPVIVNGEQADAEGVTCHEVAILKDIIHSRGYTIIYFEDSLQYRYLRDTVTVNANVVPATHGETVNEVLGSGDGTKTNQCFVLKKPPLTYVSAATPSGAESTLRVEVDGIEWEQVLSLYYIGPGKQSYTVRLDNDGDVNIAFGDGKQGVRLPTGQENIKATYRSGIGTDGEVAADSIKLLKTRPQGIRGVTNPVAASGSQEPETMDDARTNAPRTVLTMDRIVSLQDYEDFARTYAGIGKARAIVLWNGKTELVHVTIADSYGDTIDSSTETYQNLSEAIDTYRDRLAMVQIDTFEKRLFQVAAKLLIDEKYTAGDVLAEAESALEEAFSFANRDFGQPVTAAEVINILQQVAGVIAVDLDKLYLIDPAYETCTELGPTQTQPAAVLPCSTAKWPEGGDFQKAQLLLINPVGIALEEKES